MQDTSYPLEQPRQIGLVKAPRQFNQLGIILADGSGSMAGKTVGGITKGGSVNNALREMFTRLKVSRVGANFSLGVVTFDDAANLRMPITSVGPLLDDNGDYDPLTGHGGGTNIYAALEEAGRMANHFLSAAPVDGVPHSVVILLMTDGGCSDPAKTLQVASNIKQGPHGGKVQICTTLFASLGEQDASAEKLLKQVASDPVLGYKTVYDAATLREFFIGSMSKASGVQIV